VTLDYGELVGTAEARFLLAHSGNA